jgi:Cd2+/Zn2+-exporting ATPase
VISGESEVDESLLTGAEQPRAVARGSSVTGGAMNLTGVLNIRVSRTFEDANAAHVLKYVSNAPQLKSGPEKKLRRIARIYTPAVIGASVIVGLLVPLIGSLPLIPWLLRGLTLLLLANLDSAAAAVSMAHFSGIGGAAVKGIIFRGSAFADTLAHATSVIFSKTGILTTGCFEVADVNTYGMSPDRLLTLAAYAEYNSEHPMARSVVRAANGIFDRFRIQNFREYPGLGVEAEVGGVSISAGNALLMGQLGITPDLSHTEQSVVYVAVNGKYTGRILLSDAVKPDAKKALRDLHALGIDRIVMFTGDKKAAAAEIAGILGITEFYPECLPEDKVKRFKALTEMQLPGDRIVYVGDAAEDAAVLAAADIGIVLDGFGDKKELSDNSDRKDADIVILTGEVSKVPEAVMLARGTDAVVRRNLILTLGLRGLVLLLVLLGLAPMWAALLLETIAGILALFNGTRAAGFRRGTMRKALTGSKTRASGNDSN